RWPFKQDARTLFANEMQTPLLPLFPLLIHNNSVHHRTLYSAGHYWFIAVYHGSFVVGRCNVATLLSIEVFSLIVKACEKMNLGLVDDSDQIQYAGFVGYLFRCRAGTFQHIHLSVFEILINVSVQ